MKGVSTYIAATLLIAITVAIATLFVGWAVTLTQSQSQAVANKTKIGVDCTRSKITIENVYVDFASSKTRINVRNSGYLDESIVSAIAVTTTGAVSSNLTAFPVTVLMGNEAGIELNTSGIITVCGNFSKVIVTTNCVSREFDGTPKNC